MDHSRSQRRRRLWLIGLAAAAVAVVCAGLLMLSSGRTVVAELTSARDDLSAARSAITAQDADAAQGAVVSAATHAAVAADAATGPLWRVAGALPLIGATPESVTAIATSLDQAVKALLPAVEVVSGLRPASVVEAGGRVDAAALSAAVGPLQEAQAGVDAAQATLAGAPSAAAGDMVIQPVESARQELAAQLESLGQVLDTATNVAEILPPLLGAEGPRRYFFAIGNPNESRGIGGFIGTYAIVRADHGRLTVEQVGSNTDLVDVIPAPSTVSRDWVARYGDGAIVPQMNLSPNYPDAAAYWLTSWRKKTGEHLDGALYADVFALGDLVSATGQDVPLPDGGSITGAALTQFALSGIYEKFPDSDEVRNQYQEDVAKAAFDLISKSSGTDAMASALASAISDRRILAWVSDKSLEAKVLHTSMGGSLAVPNGPTVSFVALNVGGNKLDTYLRRKVRYEVGQCVDTKNMVRSTVEITLTNDIPKGAKLAPYVIAQAEVGSDGPIAEVNAQVHLPNGSEPVTVWRNGEVSVATQFEEQGRPSLVTKMVLPPRTPETLKILFREPMLGATGTSPEQPLVIPQETTVAPRPC